MTGNSRHRPADDMKYKRQEFWFLCLYWAILFCSVSAWMALEAETVTLKPHLPLWQRTYWSENRNPLRLGKSITAFPRAILRRRILYCWDKWMQAQVLVPFPDGFLLFVAVAILLAEWTKAVSFLGSVALRFCCPLRVSLEPLKFQAFLPRASSFRIGWLQRKSMCDKFRVNSNLYRFFIVKGIEDFFNFF